MYIYIYVIVCLCTVRRTSCAANAVFPAPAVPHTTANILSRHLCMLHTYQNKLTNIEPTVGREVGGWGRDPKKCTGRGWGMGSSTI